MSMLDHDILRQLADTWGLLLLFAVFSIAVLAALRPGARAHYRHCARIPLEDDTAPAPKEAGQ
jgi:cytochrome c oxidase cbb3-type subunit 4